MFRPPKTRKENEALWQIVWHLEREKLEKWKGQRAREPERRKGSYKKSDGHS